jgi:hypothetical protein
MPTAYMHTKLAAARLPDSHLPKADVFIYFLLLLRNTIQGTERTVDEKKRFRLRNGRSLSYRER